MKVPRILVFAAGDRCTLIPILMVIGFGKVYSNQRLAPRTHIATALSEIAEVRR